MKYFFLITGLIIVLVFIAQIMIARSTDGTEQQRYTVLHNEDDFEIRFYPEAIGASVVAADTSWRGEANGNFRRLAGYIFGGNQEGKSIAMTAPVHMEQSETGSRMSFVMPSSMDMGQLPKPNDKSIVISKMPADTVAALRFGGFASEHVIREKSEELLRLLQEKGIPVVSPVRYLGYNPPFQLVNRRNEVVVSVRWEKSAR
ncbi:MAG: hypothetical protein RL213_1999 [Bacteroidota bacterium]|jgi:effector-binding domain-containing protein